MGKNFGAVFAVILASLVLFAGCVARTKSPSETPSGSPLVNEAPSGSGEISQEDLSGLESELSGLEGDESLFIADEFESEILG